MSFLTPCALTKYRRKYFDNAMLEDLKRIFEKIGNEYDVVFKEFNGE